MKDKNIVSVVRLRLFGSMKVTSEGLIDSFSIAQLLSSAMNESVRSFAQIPYINVMLRDSGVGQRSDWNAFD